MRMPITGTIGSNAINKNEITKIKPPLYIELKVNQRIRNHMKDKGFDVRLVSFYFLLPLSICIYLFFIIPSIGDPITQDELWWYRKPVFIEKGDFSGEFAKYLWSPPLYGYLLTLSFWLFDINEVSARLIGVLFNISTIIITFLLAKEISLVTNIVRVASEASGRKDKDGNQKGSSIIKVQTDGSLREGFNANDTSAPEAYRQEFSGVRPYFAAALAVFIYACNPMVIQGSLIVDIDNTILTTFMMLIIYCFIKVRDCLNAKNIVLLCLIYSLALWSKLTLPPLIIFSILLFFLFNKDLKPNLYKIVIIFFAGSTIFLCSWWVVSYLEGLPFLHPLVYFLKSFTGQMHESMKYNKMLFVRRVFRLGLWISPIIIVFIFLLCIERVKDFLKNRYLEIFDLLLIYSVFIFIGYIVVGGLLFGFPKYHYPMMPVLSIVISVYIINSISSFSKKNFYLLIVIVLIGIIYNIVFVGDILYEFSFVLRKIVVENPLESSKVLQGIVYRLLYLVFFVVVVLFFLKKYTDWNNLKTTFIISLAITLISSSMALDIIQAKSPYLTRYCYGEAGTWELIEYLKKNKGEDGVTLATRDISYYMNEPLLPDAVWYKPEKFLKKIEDYKVVNVVYSIAHNDIRQFKKTLYNPRVQEELQTHFIEREIGTYSVWTRK